jgi:hypothetical protein
MVTFKLIVTVAHIQGSLPKTVSPEFPESTRGELSGFLFNVDTDDTPQDVSLSRLNFLL